MKNLFPFLIIFFTLSSCNSLVKQKITKDESITEKLLTIVFKNENISKLSTEQYIHVKIEKLDNAHSLTTIVINNIESKKASYISSFNGIKVFTYQVKGIYNLRKELDDSAFFVPDCPSYEFLVFSKKNEILDVKKVAYYPFENSNRNDVEIRLE